MTETSRDRAERLDRQSFARVYSLETIMLVRVHALHVERLEERGWAESSHLDSARAEYHSAVARAVGYTSALGGAP